MLCDMEECMIQMLKNRLKYIVILVLVGVLACPCALGDYATLQKGDKSTQVLQMQLALQSLGYDLQADGSFGSGTYTVVKKFQKDQGLTADGKAGNQTLQRLFELAPQWAYEEGSTTSSASASSTVAARVQTTGGTLTLRQTQSTSGKALKYIPNLTIVPVSEKGSKWCKVTYDGQTGYALTSYLNFDVTNVTVTASPTATPVSTVSYQAQVQTTGGTLTLRATQSTSAKALKYIPNLTIVSVTQKGSKWCKVSYDGQTGYVLTSYLNFNVTSATATPTPTPTPTPTTAAVTYRAQVQTTGGTLTLRATQSTSAKALKYIPNLTIVTVTQKGSKWCKVSYDGQIGYVLTSYLNFNVTSATATPTPTPTPTPTAETTIAYVSTSGGTLTLRATQSTSAKALKYIPNGTQITVLSKGATWSKVTYEGQTGYVLSTYLSTQAAVQATATPTPTPAAYDTSIFTRTLKLNYTGSDVTALQQRLKELNYLSAVTGTYDETTQDAVKLFQSYNSLTVDGAAGSGTLTKLFSTSAVRYTADLTGYTTMHIYYRSSSNPSVSSVTKMQTALKALGYTVTVNGSFDETTYDAVVQFQMRNNLTVDGAAGPATQSVLYSSSAKGADAEPCLVLSDSDGKMTAPDTSQIQLLHWYNVVKPSLSSGSKLLIYDPDTGLSWTLRVYSRGHHADCEPLTLKDTLIMRKSFKKTSWTVQVVYVQLPDGRWTMATMHNRPHLSGSISDNGFDGHMCVHFLRDLSECQANDPDYGMTNQTTLRTAWKALTGETVN